MSRFAFCFGFPLAIFVQLVYHLRVAVHSRQLGCTTQSPLELL